MRFTPCLSSPLYRLGNFCSSFVNLRLVVFKMIFRFYLEPSSGEGVEGSQEGREGHIVEM